VVGIRRMRQVEGLSVVSDLDHGRIVELLDGRSRRRVERYLHSLLQRGRKATGVVSIDPHEGYRYALRNETPGHAGPLLGCVHHARRQDLHVGQGHFALKQDLDFRYLRQDVDRSLRARLRGSSPASLGGSAGLIRRFPQFQPSQLTGEMRQIVVWPNSISPQPHRRPTDTSGRVCVLARTHGPKRDSA
jgi:hypothetical protein